MPATKSRRPTAPRDRVLTRAQIVRLLEDGARKRRAMTAEELIDAYRRGDLEEPCEVMDLLGLAFLLPEDDRLHAPLVA